MGKAKVQEGFFDPMDVLENALSAAAGGAVSTFSLFPLNVITTKLATAPPNKSSLEVIKATVQNQGMSGLFQGVGPKLLQSVLGKFLYFVWFTILTKKWKQRNGGSL